MDTFFSRVSDEALFLQMTLGDKLSNDILVKRYMHIGRQMAGSLIRQKHLFGVTDQDFVEAIYNTIIKVFRYYNYSTSFVVFCKKLLNQTVVREVERMFEKKEKDFSNLHLDELIMSGENYAFHEIIASPQLLNESDQFDVDNFLLNISSDDSPKRRNIARIYLMHQIGYTIEEIVKILDISSYEVRNALTNKEDLDLLIGDYRLRLK